MRSHDVFFYGASAFLVGTTAALLGVSPFFISCVVFIVCLFCFVHWYNTQEIWILHFGFLGLFVLFGVWYASLAVERFYSVQIPYGDQTTFIGCFIDEPKIKETYKEATIHIREPFNARAKLYTRNSEYYMYGDCVRGVGTITPPDNLLLGYSMKNSIHGTISFPTLSYLDVRDSSFFKESMLRVRKKIMSSFFTVLPRDEATFLAGLTIGAKGEFSDDLNNIFRTSGLTHIVALSGYNIMIIVSVMMSLFLFVLKKRNAFIGTIICIFLFTLFAGAESSLVRAAILGCIGLFAGEVGRVYNARQAITFAAFVMVLINPFVLLFDIGFQLSFLAFLSISYCSPVICDLLDLNERKNGFIHAIVDSFSAQLGTLPIIAFHFGSISVVGIVSTLFVMWGIPMIMALGFIAGGLSLFSSLLSEPVLILAGILLKIELYIARIFGSVSSVEWNISSLFVFVYYFVFVVLIFIYLKKRNVRDRLRIFQ